MKHVLFLAVLTTSAFALAKPVVVLQCNNEMFDVSVVRDVKASREHLTISISDISGHGKDYVQSVQKARARRSLRTE